MRERQSDEHPLLGGLKRLRDVEEIRPFFIVDDYDDEVVFLGVIITTSLAQSDVEVERNCPVYTVEAADYIECREKIYLKSIGRTLLWRH